MIIYPDNNIEIQSHRPNENWTGVEDVIAVEDNSDLALKIMQYAPYFERILGENGNLIDITPTERPPEPSEPTELEILKEKYAMLQGAVDFIVMNP